MKYPGLFTESTYLEFVTEPETDIIYEDGRMNAMNCIPLVDNAAFLHSDGFGYASLTSLLGRWGIKVISPLSAGTSRWVFFQIYDAFVGLLANLGIYRSREHSSQIGFNHGVRV